MFSWLGTVINKAASQIGATVKPIMNLQDDLNSIRSVSSLPGVSNRWKSMIEKPIDQSISIDKIS